MAFDLSNYETVESRLARFWETHPEGRVETTLMNYDGESCIVRSIIWKHRDDANPTATGYAHEIHTERGVNMTSFVENAETSSLGRVLANMGYATQGKRPSREEMQKVERLGGNPQPAVHTPIGAFATPKQIGYIKKLARDASLDDLRLLELIQRTLNSDEAVLELLKSHEASAVIEALK
jgi:ribosomal protein L35AE/L33A